MARLTKGNLETGLARLRQYWVSRANSRKKRYDDHTPTNTDDIDWVAPFTKIKVWTRRQDAATPTKNLQRGDILAKQSRKRLWSTKSAYHYDRSNIANLERDTSPTDNRFEGKVAPEDDQA